MYMKEKEQGMKKIGIIKEIDKLGRLVIPKKMRESLGITREVEILLTDEGILIRNPSYRITERKEK